MKLGFSTNAFTKKDLLYAIKSISKFKYNGIEIVADVPHSFLPMKESRMLEIKNTLTDFGLEVSNINVNTSVGWYDGKSITDQFEPSLSNIDNELRRWRIDYTKHAIDLAIKLGSPSICITSGLHSINNTIYFFKESLDELAEYAEKKNVLIAVEYEPGLLVGNSSIVYDLTKEYPNLGLNLDVCHAKVLNENVGKIINRFGKKIFHTHISDCKDNVHYHLIPGLGDINFESIIISLKKIKYNGFLTAELYTYSNDPEMAAKETMNYLTKWVCC